MGVYYKKLKKERMMGMKKFSSVLSKLLIASLVSTTVIRPVCAESREIGAGYEQGGFVTETGTAVEFSNSSLKVKGFLKANGDLMLSGDNSCGQLGTGDRSTQEGEVKALTEVQGFSIGSKFVIAVRKDGTLWGWGVAGNGELLNAGTTVLEPVKICDGKFRMVSCGNTHVVALTQDGDLFEWGDGTAQMSFLGGGFVQVSAGAEHYAAIKKDGSLWTWGSNANGELCNGGTAGALRPAKVADGFEKVSCGDGFTVALDSRKRVWGAGKGNAGQLGGSNRSTFSQLSDSLFWDVAAGSSCTVLQSVTGTVTTWGTGTATNGKSIAHDTYTIRFLGGDGAEGEMEPVTAKFGRSLLLPKCGFKKDGYVFRGWSTEEGGAVEFQDGASVLNLLTRQVFQDEILYAVWEPGQIVLETDDGAAIQFGYGEEPGPIVVPRKTVKVSLDSNGGSYVPDLDVPLAFDGYVDENGNQIFNWAGQYVGNCTSSGKLTAVWTARETELPVPERSGYTFSGWAPSVSAQSGSMTFNGTEDAALVATWIEGGKVVYNYSQNGGIQSSKEVASVSSGEAVPLDVAATKVGWEFVGWNTDPSATKGLESLTMGSNPVILYAVFSKKVTVAFQDGEASASYEVVYYNNETGRQIELPALADHAQGTPLGWCRDGNTKEILTGESTVIGLTNVTFASAYSKEVEISFRSGADGSYVRKEKGNVINVTGGTAIPAEIVYPADVQSVDGFEFTGWKSGDGIVAGGTSGSFTENTELYGQRGLITLLLRRLWKVPALM